MKRRKDPDLSKGSQPWRKKSMYVLQKGRTLGPRLPQKQGQDGKETNPYPVHHGGRQPLGEMGLGPPPRV